VNGGALAQAREIGRLRARQVAWRATPKNEEFHMKSQRLMSMFATLSTCLALAASASAEANAYVRINASKQGPIKGSVTQKGRESSIMVIAVDHTIVSPRDSASGQATGKRQHKPFVITKEVDASSPLLQQALASNEVLKDVTIEFWQASQTGAEKGYYTITLKDAVIASIHHVMPNNKDPQLVKLAAYEEVALVYKSITWTFTDGGLTATDEWVAGK
jgi:type VI secretion system secreted protein Hcp